MHIHKLSNKKLRIGLYIVTLTILTAWLAAPGAAATDQFAAGLSQFNAGEWAAAAATLAAAAWALPTDIAVRLTAGVALANVKRYAEAADQFKAAARMAPNWVLPQFLLDGTYAEMGDTAASRTTRYAANRALAKGIQVIKPPDDSGQPLLASLQKYPNNAIAHCLLGDLYQLQGDVAGARAEYEKASELAPKWAKPVFNRGLAELNTDPKAAEMTFGEAAKLDPGNSKVYLWRGDAYRRQNKLDLAWDDYQRAAKDPALAAEVNTRLGAVKFQAGDYVGAQQQFGLAARQAPDDPRPLAGEAQVLQNLGKVKEAETKYAQAADVLQQNEAPAPSQAVVANQIAQVQAAQGRLEDAVSNYHMGFELHPTRANADALTAIQQRANQLGQGIANYEALLAKEPKNTKAMLYLLSAYKLSGNTSGRLDMAERLVKLDPANAPDYYTEIGSARMAMGDADKASKAYLEALRLGNATTWAFTARSAGQAGALGMLLEEYSTAFEKRPNPVIAKVLFEIQSARGDAAGMVRTAQWLSKQNPQDAVCWLLLGEAFERAGDRASALDAYARAALIPDPKASELAKAKIQAIKSAPAGPASTGGGKR